MKKIEGIARLYVLVKDVTYQKRGIEVRIERGTRVWVDSVNLIACHGQDHFQIDAGDFATRIWN